MTTGDAAIWLVWWSDGTRYVYPCRVLQVVSTDAAASMVILRYYQDNGVWDDPDQVALRVAALHDEAAIHQESRLHLDWAFRTTSMPGEGRRQQRPAPALTPPDAPAPTSSRPAPSNERPPPPKRVRENTAAAPAAGNAASGSQFQPQDDVVNRLGRCEDMFGVCQAQMAKLGGEITELKGKFDAWDVTLQRMQDYQRQQAMMAEELRKLKRIASIALHFMCTLFTRKSNFFLGSLPSLFLP